MNKNVEGVQTDNSNSGITLVALIVTIIILLILAGVTIAQLTGNRLFENAKLAKQKAENAQELENIILADYDNKINQYVDGTREQIMVDKDEYENLKNQIEELSTQQENLLDLYDSNENVFIPYSRTNIIIRTLSDSAAAWYDTGVSVTLLPGTYIFSSSEMNNGRFILATATSTPDKNVVARRNNEFTVTTTTKVYLCYCTDYNLENQIQQDISLKLVRK